jgi:hypothetical protein
LVKTEGGKKNNNTKTSNKKEEKNRHTDTSSLVKLGCFEGVGISLCIALVMLIKSQISYIDVKPC